MADAAATSRAFRLAQLAALGLVAGLLALLVWDLTTNRRGSHLIADVNAARKPHAPPFELLVLWSNAETWPLAMRGRALADAKIDLRELRQYPVVINFWASWCGPCKDEAPRLVASARAHRGKVVFLGIDVQDFKGDARRFLRNFDTNYVSARDGSGSTYGDYGLTGVPETYWLDRRGRVVAHYAGEISRRQLEDGIRASTRTRS